MKLSDVMSASGLSGFAEMGLVIFVVVFIGIVFYTFSRRNRDRFQRARKIPLDDLEAVPQVFNSSKEGACS